jgi:hypothetical protein
MSLFNKLKDIIDMYGPGFSSYFVSIALIEKANELKTVAYYNKVGKYVAYSTLGNMVTVERRKNKNSKYSIRMEILAQDVLPNDRLLIER